MIGVMTWSFFQGTLPFNFNFQRKVVVSENTQFDLKAIEMDAAGIDPQSGFVLSSTEDLSESEIKKLVKERMMELRNGCS